MKVNKKFIASATSAALVASAIVPVASAASFSDIENNTHKDAILALAEAGIISGYTDGTFKPNAQVTRGNVTKLLGKWLVKEGYDIPADYNTVERFTDVPVTHADQELVKYAALVKDAKVFNGSNGQLLQANNMTREQMAVVLVRTIKTVYGINLIDDYKAANFESNITDLDKATADENREAIVALEYAELTTVTAFNPKNTLTRGQFASFLNRAIEYAAKQEVAETVEVESVTAVNGTITVTLKEKAEKVDVKDFTVTQAINGGEAKEVTPSKAELAEDGKTVTLTVEKVAQTDAKQSVVYTVNKVAAEAFEVAAVSAELKIESATAINAKQVEVKFAAPVKRLSAETVANYEIKLTTGGSAINLESVTYVDEKTVLINLEVSNSNVQDDAKLANGSSYELTVKKDLEDASGKKIDEDLKSTFTFMDTQLPEVKNVTTLGIRDILVEFSEPVKPAVTATTGTNGKDLANQHNNFTLYALDKDGVPVTATNLITAGSNASFEYVGTDRKVIKIKLDSSVSLQSGVKYTLTANTGSTANDKLADFAGYNLPTVAKTIEYVADTTVPQFTDVTVISQGVVEVKFNKPVNVEPGNFYWNTDGVETNNTKQASTVTPIDSQTYRVDFGTNLIPAGTAYIFATGVTDYNANTIATTKKQVTVANDLQPKVESAELKSKTSIEVKFNTEVIGKKSNFVIKNSKGQLIAISSASAETTASKTHILTVPSLADDTYTIEVSGIKDGLNREIEKFTKELNVVGVTTLTEKHMSAYTHATANNDIIILTVDKDGKGVKEESVNNLANWLVDTDLGNRSLNTISGASVSVIPNTDNKAFSIKLPKGTIKTSTFNVQLQNAVDTDGNQIAPKSFTVSTIKQDERNLDISTGTAKVSDVRTVEVKVNTLLGSLTASEFVVKADGSNVAVSSVEAVNDYQKGESTIKLTLATDADSSKTYVVETASTVNNSKDIYGSKLQASKSVVAPYSVSDSVEKAFVTGSKEVTVVLKNTTSADAVNPVAGDFTVKNSAGTEIAVAAVDTTTINGKAAIKLTTASTVSETQTYTVAVKDNALTTVSGNKLVKGELTTSTSLIATKLEFDAGADKTAIETDEKITITFSESIDASIAGSGKSVTITDGSGVNLDTITLQGVGEIKLPANTITASGTASAATYEVVDNTKLVITLGTISSATINYAPGAATFIPYTSVLTVDGRPATASVTPQALVSDLIAAKVITLTPSTDLTQAVVSQNFTAGTNKVYANTTDVTTGTNTSIDVKGVTLTPTLLEGVVTVAPTGSANNNIAAGEVLGYIFITDDTVKSQTLKVVAKNAINSGSTPTAADLQIKY